jgi:hypothetical protein
MKIEHVEPPEQPVKTPAFKIEYSAGSPKLAWSVMNSSAARTNREFPISTFETILSCVRDI